MFQLSAYPDEPYWHGVRRRVRSALLVALLMVISAAVCFLAFRVSQSSAITIVVGLGCGLVTAQLDLSLDPLPMTSQVTKSDKRIAMIFLLPMIAVLGVSLVSLASRSLIGIDLAGVAVLAQILGYALASTFRLLRMGTDQ